MQIHHRKGLDHGHVLKCNRNGLGESLLLLYVFMNRDSDSLIIQREVDSVNVWLQSSEVGHIMRGIVNLILVVVLLVLLVVLVVVLLVLLVKKSNALKKILMNVQLIVDQKHIRTGYHLFSHI